MIKVTYRALQGAELHRNGEDSYESVSALEPLIKELGFGASVIEFSSTNILLKGGVPGSAFDVSFSGPAEEMVILRAATCFSVRAEEQATKHTSETSNLLPMSVPGMTAFLKLVSSYKDRLHRVLAAAMFAAGVRDVKDIEIGRAMRSADLVDVLEMMHENQCSFIEVYIEVA